MSHHHLFLRLITLSICIHVSQLGTEENWPTLMYSLVDAPAQVLPVSGSSHQYYYITPTGCKSLVTNHTTSKNENPDLE